MLIRAQRMTHTPRFRLIFATRCSSTLSVNPAINPQLSQTSLGRERRGETETEKDEGQINAQSEKQ